MNQVAAVRRELDAWVSTYQTMLTVENQPKYTDRQLEVAESRAEWLEEYVSRLEDLEADLAGAFDEG